MTTTKPLSVQEQIAALKKKIADDKVKLQKVQSDNVKVTTEISNLYANNKDILDRSDGKKDYEDEINKLKSEMEQQKRQFQPTMMPITNWDKELSGLIYKADKDYERLAKANVATAAKIPGGAKAGTAGAKPPTGTPSTAKGTPATAKDAKPADSTAKKTNGPLETPVKGLELT